MQCRVRRALRALASSPPAPPPPRRPKEVSRGHRLLKPQVPLLTAAPVPWTCKGALPIASDSSGPGSDLHSAPGPPCRREHHRPLSAREPRAVHGSRSRLADEGLRPEAVPAFSGEGLLEVGREVEAAPPLPLDLPPSVWLITGEVVWAGEEETVGPSLFKDLLRTHHRYGGDPALVEPPAWWVGVPPPPPSWG